MPGKKHKRDRTKSSPSSSQSGPEKKHKTIIELFGAQQNIQGDTKSENIESLCDGTITPVISMEELSNKETDKEPVAKEVTKENLDDESGVLNAIKKLETNMRGQMELIIKKLDEQIGELRESCEYRDGEVKEIRRDQKDLSERCDMLEGMVARMGREIEEIKLTNIDLKMTSMRDNLTIWGVEEKLSEDPRATEAVLKAELEAGLGLAESAVRDLKIEKCYRQGRGRRNRPIVVQFNSYKDKEFVLEAARKQGRGSKLSINEQFPQEVEQERKRLYPVMKKEREEGHNAKLIRAKLIVDGKEHAASKQYNNMDINVDIFKESRKHTIMHAQAVEFDGSTFQGHSAIAECFDDIKPILCKMYGTTCNTASATHNIWAARFKCGTTDVERCNDDGEFGAATRILRIMQGRKLTNAMVVVTRWKRGGDLGPVRFTHIEKAAEQAMDIIQTK